MYPLGHMVSDMSSTVILGRGCACCAVQNRRGRTDAHATREEALRSMLVRMATWPCVVSAAVEAGRRRRI